VLYACPCARVQLANDDGSVVDEFHIVQQRHGPFPAQQW